MQMIFNRPVISDCLTDPFCNSPKYLIWDSYKTAISVLEQKNASNFRNYPHKILSTNFYVITPN